jgi:hypothetical protein
MKKILITFLILIFSVSLNANSLTTDDLNSVRVSPEVHDMINTPLPNQKLKTGDWIWVSIIAIVAIVGISISARSITPGEIGR